MQNLLIYQTIHQTHLQLSDQHVLGMSMEMYKKLFCQIESLFQLMLSQYVVLTDNYSHDHLGHKKWGMFNERRNKLGE